jgi:hypothetical protein
MENKIKIYTAIHFVTSRMSMTFPVIGYFSADIEKVKDFINNAKTPSNYIIKELESETDLSYLAFLERW